MTRPADMIEHECDFPDTCPVCLGPKPKPTMELTGASRPFRARFPGHCGGCNLAIHEGQMIRRHDFGVLHVGCDQ